MAKNPEDFFKAFLDEVLRALAKEADRQILEGSGDPANPPRGIRKEARIDINGKLFPIMSPDFRVKWYEEDELMPVFLPPDAAHPAHLGAMPEAEAAMWRSVGIDIDGEEDRDGRVE